MTVIIIMFLPTYCYATSRNILMEILSIIR